MARGSSEEKRTSLFGRRAWASAMKLEISLKLVGRLQIGTQTAAAADFMSLPSVSKSPVSKINGKAAYRFALVPSFRATLPRNAKAPSMAKT